MDRCEKLRDNLYGVELLTGSITPVKEHIAQIFYIVNNTDNSEFIENEALQMITQFGKTEYNFCGTRMSSPRQKNLQLFLKISGQPHSCP